MNFPRAVLDIANEEASAHGDDIDKAVEDAVARVRGLDDYADLVNDLVRHAVLQLVYDARHRINWTLKRQAGTDHARPKINLATEGVRDAYRSYYDKCVAGRTLGNILGKELAGLAEVERAQANGHNLNAELLEKLAPLVPDDKTVRQAVPEKKLRALDKRIRREHGEAA